LGDGRLETLKINSVNATSTSFSFFFYTVSFFSRRRSTRPGKSLSLSDIRLFHLKIFSSSSSSFSFSFTRRRVVLPYL
jgi:hypothetical protein